MENLSQRTSPEVRQKTIKNTRSLVKMFRVVWSRKQLASIIECSSASIWRWEDGSHEASEKYVSGFNRAINMIGRKFDRIPEIRDAFENHMKVKIR